MPRPRLQPARWTVPAAAGPMLGGRPQLRRALNLVATAAAGLMLSILDALAAPPPVAWAARASDPGLKAAAPETVSVALLPIDRVELVVEGETLTRSEFLAQARVLLAWQRPDWSAHEPYSAELTGLLRAHIIDAMLIAMQARRIGLDEDNDEHEFEAEWQLRGTHPTLADLGPLRMLLRRARRNDRYLAQRLALRQKSGAPPSHSLGRNSEALTAWLVELRRAAQVRVVADSGLLEPL